MVVWWAQNDTTWLCASRRYNMPGINIPQTQALSNPSYCHSYYLPLPPEDSHRVGGVVYILRRSYIYMYEFITCTISNSNAPLRARFLI